jgi:Skp family chaperone for outer membrane proteins
MKDETLSQSMLIHAAVAMSGTSFDDFIENIVDVTEVDESDPTAFFIQTYVQPMDELMKKYDKEIQKAKAELKALEESM